VTLLWQGGWTRWPTEGDQDVSSNPYHSVILWYPCSCPEWPAPASKGHKLSFFISYNQSSLFSRADHLPCQLVFQHMGMACGFKISLLNNVQPSWTSLPLRTASQGTLSTSLLNRSKSALWKSKVAVLLTPLLTSPRIKNSVHGLQLSHHTQVCLCSAATGPEGAFPSWLTHQLCQEVLFCTLRNLLDCFHCIIFPEDIWSAEIPHENKGQWPWDFYQLLTEYFICLFVHIGWSITESHHDILVCWLSPWFLPINTQSCHHHHQAPDSQNTL